MDVSKKDIVQKRFARNISSYNQEAIIQRQIASRVGSLLSKLANEFERVLEVGCGTGFLTQQMIKSCSIETYILNDLVLSAYQEVIRSIGEKDKSKFTFLHGDAENLRFPRELDAIVSTSTFQWFTCIEGFLKKASSLLRNRGILAFSTFGKDNFKEIKATLDIGLEYKAKEELCTYLRKDFRVLHVEEWTQHQLFKAPVDVLKHMKQTGVNGVARSVFTKGKLAKFQANYKQSFSVNGSGVGLTFHPIIVIAQKI